jgi:hypothetical protein
MVSLLSQPAHCFPNVYLKNGMAGVLLSGKEVGFIDAASDDSHVARVIVIINYTIGADKIVPDLHRQSA